MPDQTHKNHKKVYQLAENFDVYQHAENFDVYQYEKNQLHRSLLC